MGRTVTVGYALGMSRYFTARQWQALDAGRRQNHREWEKFCGVRWAGSSRPRIYITTTTRTDVWAITYSSGKIYISRAAKFAYKFEDADFWTNLFMHEYSHLLIGMSHCYAPVAGGYCVRSISRSPRLLVPCASCARTLRSRYGSPNIVSDKLTVTGDAEINLKLRQLNGEPIPAHIRVIDFVGDLLSVREIEALDSSIRGHGLTVNPNDASALHLYADRLANGTAEITDTSGDDRFKLTEDYALMAGPTRYMRMKFFGWTAATFRNGGHNVARIGNREIEIVGRVTVQGDTEIRSIESAD